MKQYKFCLKMQGVTLKILTNSFDYIKYLKNYFGSIEQDTSLKADIEVLFDLEETVVTTPRFVEIEKATELKRYGRRIWAKNNEVVCDGIGPLGNLKLRCAYAEKTKICGSYSLIKSSYIIKLFYQQTLRKRKFNYYKFDVYATLTYYLIYYPVLYHLEKKNIFILHASSVVFEGRGILMPGLPGVGKSTLCLSFLSRKNSKFLSVLQKSF